MEKTEQRPYDIRYDLGSPNYYDETAGKAILLAWVTNNPVLAIEASELSELIQNIPYNHERFYRVIAKCRHVEKLIEAIENTEYAVLSQIDEFGESREVPYNQWGYSLIHREGRYEVCLGIIQTYGHLETGTQRGIIERLKENLLQNKLEAQTLSREHGMQSVTINRYYDQGTLIYETIDHIHDDGICIGGSRTFFFDDLPHALKAWQIVLAFAHRDNEQRNIEKEQSNGKSSEPVTPEAWYKNLWRRLRRNK